MKIQLLNGSYLDVPLMISVPGRDSRNQHGTELGVKQSTCRRLGAVYLKIPSFFQHAVPNRKPCPHPG